MKLKTANRSNSKSATAFEKLKQLIVNLHQCVSQPEQHAWTQASYRSNGVGAFQMDHKQTAEYFGILDELVGDTGVPPARSRSSVDDLVTACIIRALKPSGNARLSIEDRATESIEELKDVLLAAEVEWEIYCFVERLQVSTDGLQFGKAFFCNHDYIDLKDRVDVMTVQLRRNQGLSKAHENCWPKDVKGVTICKLIVKAADKDAALQIANFELERTLCVLNFFASYFFPSDFLPTLSSRRQNGLGQECAFYFKSNSPAWGMRGNAPSTRPSFDPKAVAKDKDVQIAFNKASKLLNCHTSGLGNRIINAMKWAGRASLAENREEAFIFYSIALESLILRNDHNEQLAYKLRLRVGHLIGHDNSTRTQYRDQVKHLYSLRSKIVHSGKNEIPQSDLRTLQIITQSCIYRLSADPIFDGLNSEEEIESWFENIIISGSENLPS